MRRNEEDRPRDAYDNATKMRVFVMTEVVRARQAAIVNGLNRYLFPLVKDNDGLVIHTQLLPQEYHIWRVYGGM